MVAATAARGNGLGVANGRLSHFRTVANTGCPEAQIFLHRRIKEIACPGVIQGTRYLDLESSLIIRGWMRAVAG